jgi:hypothetical protein
MEYTLMPANGDRMIERTGRPDGTSSDDPAKTGTDSDYDSGGVGSGGEGGREGP